jgi:hypothetical protein
MLCGGRVGASMMHKSGMGALDNGDGGATGMELGEGRGEDDEVVLVTWHERTRGRGWVCDTRV